MKAIYVLAGALMAWSSLADASTVKCVDAFNAELRAMGLGTYDEPALNTRKVKLTSQNGVEFIRTIADFEQVLGIADFLVNEKRIYLKNPSMVFKGQEEKQILLNEKCEIKSIELKSGSANIFVTPDTCQMIARSREAASPETALSIIRAAAPKATWPTCEPLVDVVRFTCDRYKDKLAKPSRPTGGDPAKPPSIP